MIRKVLIVGWVAKDRHNSRYLLPNCYQIFTSGHGLAVGDQPISVYTSLLGRCGKTVCILQLRFSSFHVSHCGGCV
jgi:hypothetical protein